MHVCTLIYYLALVILLGTIFYLNPHDPPYKNSYLEATKNFLSKWGMEPKDYAWIGPSILGINFTITRGDKSETPIHRM
jgi:hypothetical protein